MRKRCIVSHSRIPAEQLSVVPRYQGFIIQSNFIVGLLFVCRLGSVWMQSSLGILRTGSGKLDTNQEIK